LDYFFFYFVSPPFFVFSFYPGAGDSGAVGGGQPNEMDSFQDFMSQVEELDNLEEFQMDLNSMGVIPGVAAQHFKS